MRRIFIAALVGGLVYYIWQMLGWIAFPLHGPTVHGLPDEGAIREALTAQNLDDGLYFIPYGNDNEAMMDAESEFYQRHVEGPNINIFYTAEGRPPMPTPTMAIGLATDVAAALIVALLLSSVGPGCALYWRRVGFVTAFGIFLALTAHVSYFNWMRFPTDFTVAFIIDAIGGWFLVGLVIAAIVRPDVTPSAATGSD